MTTPSNDPPSLASRPGWIRRPHAWLCVTGVVVVVSSSLIGSGGNLAVIPFLLWMLLPWALLGLFGRFLPGEWISGGAAGLGLVFEAGIRSAVFLYPQGSTAAVALVFSPAVALMIAMPLGGVLGWVLGKAWRLGRIARVAILVLVPPVLFLCWLGLARPDKFPLAVARRHAALERIGPPRVNTGRDRFQRTVVSDRSVWISAANLDGRAGEELVLATHAKAEALDPETLRPALAVDYSALTPSTWSWYSRLVRIKDRIFIAQTGGGYSETKILALDGSTLWHYRPNPQLSPGALRPADLDADGETEFYSSTSDAVVRLDGAGRVVWRQPTNNASLVTLAPREGALPAWVLALEYGRKILVWDEHGKVIASLPVGEDNAPLSIVTHEQGRALVGGGDHARGVDLQGRQLFAVPLPDMRLTEVASARFAPSGPPILALVASADQHTKRWRALLLSASGDILYEEISDDWLNWLAVRKADGSDELFLKRPNLIERLRPIEAKNR